MQGHDELQAAVQRTDAYITPTAAAGLVATLQARDVFAKGTRCTTPLASAPVDSIRKAYAAPDTNAAVKAKSSVNNSLTNIVLCGHVANATLKKLRKGLSADGNTVFNIDHQKDMVKAVSKCDQLDLHSNDCFGHICVCTTVAAALKVEAQHVRARQHSTV